MARICKVPIIENDDTMRDLMTRVDRILTAASFACVRRKCRDGSSFPARGG